MALAGFERKGRGEAAVVEKIVGRPTRSLLGAAATLPVVVEGAPLGALVDAPTLRHKAALLNARCIVRSRGSERKRGHVRARRRTRLA